MGVMGVVIVGGWCSNTRGGERSEKDRGKDRRAGHAAECLSIILRDHELDEKE